MPASAHTWPLRADGRALQLPLVQEVSQEDRLKAIEKKLDDIYRKLDLIFGPNVVIGGRFVDLTAK